MKLPTTKDWSLNEIERQEPNRARDLESVNPESLAQQIRKALAEAVKRGVARFAIDSELNQFQVCRPIIQFPAPAHCIDAFFNSRRGYRAHYWASPEMGMDFNRSLIDLLSECLSYLLPETIQARKLTVHSDSHSRYETDIGSSSLSKATMLRALDPMVSKIWLCERLIQRDGSSPVDTGLIMSALWSPKLDIPNWNAAKNPTTGEIGEGSRAPYPAADQAWLDVKGGFADSRSLRQLKDPLKRARMIHELGWT